MAMAYLTIAGLYDYDPEIFADVEFPGEDVDKDTIIDTIIYDCGELPLVYTKPDFMRKQLKRWAEINRLTWQRIYLALTEEYNPLHNYDRHEEWDDDGTSVGAVMGYNEDEFTDSNKVTTGNKRKGRAYGNIGVTTSAQMIQGEVDTRMMYNYAKIISDMFKTEFCIMVY